MLKLIEQYLEAISDLSFKTAEETEQFRIKYLGKKGVMQSLFTDFKSAKTEDKKALGLALNGLKKAVESTL